MLTKRILLLVLLAVAILLGSCGNEMGISIPDGTGLVALDIIGTAPAGTASSSVRSLGSRAAGDPMVVSVLDLGGLESGVLTLTEIVIALESIELEMEDISVDTTEEEEQELEIEYEGPYIVDLVAETSEPSIDDIYLLPGVYDEIELKIAKMEGDELGADGNPMVVDTDPLYGNSIYIVGTYTGDTAGGTVTDASFTFILDLDEEFELTGEGDTSLGFEVVDGQALPLLIAFRLAKWFDFSNSETNSDGLLDFNDLVLDGAAIVLDENQGGDNESLRSIIKKSIKESADYGEDEDEDGELGSDEDDDPDDEDTDDD